MARKALLVLLIVLFAAIPSIANAATVNNLANAGLSCPCEPYAFTCRGPLRIQGKHPFRPGSVINASGSGFTANSTVDVYLDDIKIGSALVDSTGRVSTSVTIPADAAKGVHTLRLQGAGKSCGTLVLRRNVIVFVKKNKNTNSKPVSYKTVSRDSNGFTLQGPGSLSKEPMYFRNVASASKSFAPQKQAEPDKEAPSVSTLLTISFVSSLLLTALGFGVKLLKQ